MRNGKLFSFHIYFSLYTLFSTIYQIYKNNIFNGPVTRISSCPTGPLKTTSFAPPRNFSSPEAEGDGASSADIFANDSADDCSRDVF
jgi:hypothetical protein